MDERLRFVVEAERAEECFTALSVRYGIQPKTGYKWLRRFEAEGVSGLAERSQRPHHSPPATPPESVVALVELRSRHPAWGAKKLVAVLRARHPELALPAPSTAAAILKREGLIRAPRRRVVRALRGDRSRGCSRRTRCGPRTSKASSRRWTDLLLPAHDRRRGLALFSQLSSAHVAALRGDEATKGSLTREYCRPRSGRC